MVTEDEKDFTREVPVSILYQVPNDGRAVSRQTMSDSTPPHSPDAMEVVDVETSLPPSAVSSRLESSSFGDLWSGGPLLPSQEIHLVQCIHDHRSQNGRKHLLVV